ncbi:MAG: hypothetical protein C4329_12835 [Chitinophagaceae bacterium]
MQLVIIANDELKEELCSIGAPQDAVWINDLSELSSEAEVIVDLLFENKTERIQKLQTATSLVIVNSVEHTLSEIDPSFIRINGWPTLLKAAVVEAVCIDGSKKELAESIFQQFNKTIRWVTDVVGFITPRVISMIVNEAYYALKEGVSTKEEIDVAMKLGTNYPYGPFEWSQKIGVEKIKALLQKLSTQQARYKPVVK